jgi:hypothetical protein
MRGGKDCAVEREALAANTKERSVPSLLRTKGPLWTNGKAHIVVIGGIDESASRIQVYDPWPPNAGRVEWRDFTTYLRGGNAARDTGNDVQAVFLCNP